MSVYLKNLASHNLQVVVVHKGKEEKLDLIAGQPVKIDDDQLAEKVRKKVNKVCVETDADGNDI